MEQIDNESSSATPKQKKDSVQGDRVTLGKDESLRVEAWIKQIDEQTKGMVKLTRSELVNYLLMKMDAEFSNSEINQIRRDHYDEAKFAYWALMKIREAKRAGEKLTLEDLMRVQKGMAKQAGKKDVAEKTADNVKQEELE